MPRHARADDADLEMAKQVDVEPSPFVRPRVRRQHLHPLVVAPGEEPAEARTPGRRCDAPSVSEPVPSPHRLYMALEVIEAEITIGHCLVEGAHELRLRHRWDFVQWCIEELAMMPRIERTLRVDEVPQAPQRTRLVDLQLLARPALETTQGCASAEHAEQQRGGHPALRPSGSVFAGGCDTRRNARSRSAR